MKVLIAMMLIVGLVGCRDYEDNLTPYTGYQNVRDVGRGYLMYEIESGTVTCREHRSRPELACWKN